MKVVVYKRDLWKAIRKHCVECCGGSFDEVQKCSGGYSDKVEKLEFHRVNFSPIGSAKLISLIHST